MQSPYINVIRVGSRPHKRNSVVVVVIWNFLQLDEFALLCELG